MKNLDFRKYFIILVPLILFSFSALAQSGAWTKYGDMPERRYGHTVDEINGKIYVVGGAIDEGSAYITHSLVYDRSLGDWLQMNHNIRGAHNSCVVDGKLYIVGGNDGVKTIATMEMFDPNTCEWTSKTTMPTDRGLAACAAINDKIFVIGGIRGPLSNLDWEGLNKIEVYDTENDTWTQLADMPTKRWGCSATAANGKIYVFGGTSLGGPYASIEIYDPQTNSWTTSYNYMPTPRYCLTSCILDSIIYVIGGWYSSGDGPIYDKVEVYNPISDEWRTDSPLPSKLAVLACTVIDGKIYVYGGAQTTHPNYGSSGIFEFTPKVIFAKQPFTDKIYARPNIDSVFLNTRFSNPDNHQFTAHLIYANSDSTQIDSLILFDDGLHKDSLSNDGLYGTHILPRLTEDFFTLCVSTIDNQTNKYYKTPDRCRFTTAGPLKLDSVSYNKVGKDFYYIRPSLRSYGSSLTIKGAKITLHLNDPWVASKNVVYFSYPDIAPGTTAKSDGSSSVTCIDSLFPGYFNLRAEITVGEYVYWTDSVNLIVTGVKDNVPIPLDFKLSQNYPNPFNPSTTLTFVIGHSSFVTLKIYDVLGKEVATLINEEKPAGTYEVTWNAGNLPSGVYFYQLKAGSYSATKKLLLLK